MSFNMSDRELEIVRKVLSNSLDNNRYGDFLNMRVDLHDVWNIKNDIDEYFDVMESRASDQMLFEQEMYNGMEQ